MREVVSLPRCRHSRLGISQSLVFLPSTSWNMDFGLRKKRGHGTPWWHPAPTAWSVMCRPGTPSRVAVMRPLSREPAASRPKQAIYLRTSLSRLLEKHLPAYFKQVEISIIYSNKINYKSGWADLNRRPLGPEPSALATALQPEKKIPCGDFLGSDGT